MPPTLFEKSSEYKAVYSLIEKLDDSSNLKNQLSNAVYLFTTNCQNKLNEMYRNKERLNTKVMRMSKKEPGGAVELINRMDSLQISDNNEVIALRVENENLKKQIQKLEFQFENLEKVAVSNASCAELIRNQFKQLQQEKDELKIKLASACDRCPDLLETNEKQKS